MGRKMGFCADRNSGVTPSLKSGVQTKVRDCDPWMFSTQTCPFGYLCHYQMLPLHLALSLVSPSHELPLVENNAPLFSASSWLCSGNPAEFVEFLFTFFFIFLLLIWVCRISVKLSPRALIWGIRDFGALFSFEEHGTEVKAPFHKWVREAKGYKCYH